MSDDSSEGGWEALVRPCDSVGCSEVAAGSVQEGDDDTLRCYCAEHHPTYGMHHRRDLGEA